MGICRNYLARRNWENTKVLAINKRSRLLLLSTDIYLDHKAPSHLFLDGIVQILWYLEIPHVKISLYSQLLLNQYKFSFSAK